MKSCINWLDKNKSKIVLAIFILGWSALWAQHSNVTLCFDDYGNASLSYAYVTPNVKGTDFSIFDLYDWAKNIYFNWGGRLLYACLFLIPMLKNGVTLFMFIQSGVITILLYLMYRMICDFLKKDSSPFVAVLLFIFFGLIGMQLHAYCTYWASASVLYIWPLVPMLSAMRYYDYICEKIKRNEDVNYKRFFIIEGISIAFTTLSQEQLGGALIVFLIVYIVLHHAVDWKKFKKIDLFCIIFAVLTYLLLIAAPGNYARMDESTWFTSLSMIDKIKVNLPRVYGLWMISDFWIFHKLLVITNIGAVILVFKKVGINLKDCVLGSAVLVSSYGFLKLQNNPYGNLKMSILFTVFFVITFLVVLRYFYVMKKIEFVSYFVAAIATVYCLVFLPVVENRSYVPYLWVTFIYIAIIFADLFYSSSKLYITQIVVFVMTLYLANASFNNYSSILQGYKDNKFIMDYNEKQIQNWKNSKEKNSEIILYAAANRRYRGIWASDNNEYTEDIEQLMKEYYNIDNEADIRWISMNSFKELAKTISYEKGIYSVEGKYPNEYRWVNNEALISATNICKEKTSITMHCMAATGSGEATLRISVGNQTKEFKINEKYSNITAQFELEPGKNDIVLMTDAKKVEGKGDSRELYYRLRSIRWE